jgi:hypothetical protein
MYEISQCHKLEKIDELAIKKSLLQKAFKLVCDNQIESDQMPALKDLVKTSLRSADS